MIPERNFHRQSVNIVVPPAISAEVSPKVIVFSYLEVLLLGIHAGQIMLRQRHGESCQPTITKPVASPRPSCVVRGISGKGVADELVLSQRLKGSFETIAEVQDNESNQEK